MERSHGEDATPGTGTEVLIVGAGPTGLTLGLALAQRRCRVRIIDRSTGPKQTARAALIHAGALEALSWIGVADEIVDNSVPLTGNTYVSRGRRIGRLPFDGIWSEFPAAAAVLESDVESILETRLRASGIEVERGHELTGLGPRQDDVVVSCRGDDGGKHTIATPWVIGCDGYHSDVREWLGVGFEGGDYKGRWGVLDATIEGWAHPSEEMTTFWNPMLWSVPLPSGERRLFFAHEGRSAPTRADAQAIVDAVMSGATVTDVSEPSSFALHHRVAASYRQGRILLAGDASHAASAALATGMSQGIQDAVNLGWKLALVLAGAARESLIDTYEEERRPAAIASVKRAHRGELDQDLTEPDAISARDARVAASLARRDQQLAVAEEIAELTSTYDMSPIVLRADDDALGPTPGARVPNAGPIQVHESAATTWRELARGRHMLLVTIGVATSEERAQAASLARSMIAGFEDHVDGYVVSVTDEVEGLMERIVPIADPEYALHGCLGAVAAGVFLIRPDGYLALRCAPELAPVRDALYTSFTGDDRRVGTP